MYPNSQKFQLSPAFKSTTINTIFTPTKANALFSQSTTNTKTTMIIPIIFFFSTTFTISFTESLNIITPTQSLSINQTLISPNNIFELGFFSTSTSPVSWYMGIWYKNLNPRTYVWVANRDNPFSDSSTSLQIINQTLILSNPTNQTQTQTPIWSSSKQTEYQTQNKTSIGLLLDTGNFILKEIKTNNLIYQSFDYPTDTLLPGMKLGWDLKTGEDKTLTSWKQNRVNPKTGEYTFNLNYHGFPEIFLYQNGKKIYRSGPWNGLRFSGVPEMKPQDEMEFNFIVDQNQVYYTFNISNTNIFSRLIVTDRGALQRLTWIPSTNVWNTFWYAPKDQCDNYRECGPFGVCDSNSSPVCKCLRGFEPRFGLAWSLRDGSGGCVRKTGLGSDCGSDKFLRVKNVKLPESTTAFWDREMGFKECGEACLRNCSCTGYAVSDIGVGSGCVFWVGDLVDLRQYSQGGQDLFVRVAASDIDDGGHATATIIGIAVGTAVLISSLICIFMWKRKVLIAKRRRNVEKKGPHERSQDFLLNDAVISSRRDYSGEKTDDLELPLFDFDTLVKATGNFSDESKLGQGGFGCVYKGRLVEGQEIAVKRLSSTSGQGIDEFKNEVRLIAKLQHRNLVRLLGCCVESEEKMLVYEYMENRSLDSIIFNKSRSSVLDWQRRFNIICGIARGLLYLHQDSRFRIIHRDLKASNILLDKDMDPKISDFGMARIFGGDQTEANTKRVVGTYGYMSPEYAMDGVFSVKSDVFSFGVLVLEIITGKKNRGFYHSNSELNLLGHVWRLWRDKKALEIVDSSIGIGESEKSFPGNEVMRCIQVGLLCVQETAEERPTMSKVMLMLSSETATMPQPKTPGFSLGRNRVESDSSSSKQDETFTVNQVTVTMLDGR